MVLHIDIARVPQQRLGVVHPLCQPFQQEKEETRPLEAGGFLNSRAKQLQKAGITANFLYLTSQYILS
jgi:hypothetical protein